MTTWNMVAWVITGCVSAALIAFTGYVVVAIAADARDEWKRGDK